MYFPDGTSPKPKIVDKFMEMAESVPGAIAVHCKAGLGRTGSLIALYCLKHFAFPAAAFIGWIRICRPGSILGPQQHFLCEQQEPMFKAGRGLATRATLEGAADGLEDAKVQMSPDEIKRAKHGDKGQGKRMMDKKLKRKTKTTLKL